MTTTNAAISASKANEYRELLEDMGMTHIDTLPHGNNSEIKVQYMHIVYGQWVIETEYLRTVDDCEFFLDQCTDGLRLDLPLLTDYPSPK